LCVVPFTQREQFHDLTREIFIRMFLAALRLVEPDQHGWIFADLDKHLQPIASRNAAEQFILTPHVVSVPHFLRAGSEVSVPEKSHLLLQRPRSFHHPLQPPTAQFDQPFTLRLLFLSLHLTPLFFRRLAQSREARDSFGIGFGPVWVWSG